MHLKFPVQVPVVLPMASALESVVFTPTLMMFHPRFQFSVTFDQQRIDDFEMSEPVALDF